MFLFRSYKFLTALYYINTIVQKIFLTPQSYHNEIYSIHNTFWILLYLFMSGVVAIRIQKQVVELFAIHSTGVFSVYMIHALNLEGTLQNTYSSLQNAFDQTHQHEDNCAIHYFTVFMTWFAILGLIHRHIVYIDPFVCGCILLAKYNVVYYSVDDPHAFLIALWSAIFLAYSMVLFVISDVYLMNTKKYICVFVASVALQELSHVIYQEPALMYQYNSGKPFWLDLLLHGWFLIPLVMKWTVYALK